jgi:IclR family acetate operon transcriptional repressor
MTDTPPTQASIAAVDRAIDVLLLFGRSLQPALGVTDIAHELDLPKSGVHRILQTLAARHLITFDPRTRKYSLGQAAVSLSQGYAARHDMQSMAAQAVNELMRTTDETAALAIRRHGSVLYRAQAVPDRELRLDLGLGRLSPLHIGAAGKAFLAFLPDHEVDDYLERALRQPQGLVAATSRTITDPETLREDLTVARERGWTTSREERLVGASAIAAPVLDYDGYPASVLAVIGPSSRLRTTNTDLIDAVTNAAHALSAQMGYRERSA